MHSISQLSTAKRTTPTAGCLLALLLLSACQTTHINTPSRITPPLAFDHTQAKAQTQDVARWWRNWGDPVLTQLIERALAQGLDMQIALARLQEARAQADLAQADLGIQVGLNANAGAVRGSVDNPLSSVPMLAPIMNERVDIKGNNLFGGVQAAWEPDIFGAKRSDADAAKAAVLGTQEQYYGAQVLLAGDIAEHYFQARALSQRHELAEKNIATLQELLRYVQGRFRAGHMTAHEVNEVNSKLSAARAAQSSLQAQRAQHIRQIAILSGDVPQTFILPDSTVDVLTHTPNAPHGDTPSEVLQRRPDIRARAAAVQARAAQLASAKADLLPRFSIQFLGQGGRIGISGDNALKGWANLFNVGIQIPLFTNGRIQANIATADARLQIALLEYDRTLLQALADVDNAYQLQTALAQQTTLMHQAAQQANQQANAARTLFRHGNKTLDTALTAQLSATQMQENALQTRLAHAQALIGLYKALGGGWTQ